MLSHDHQGPVVVGAAFQIVAGEIEVGATRHLMAESWHADILGLKEDMILKTFRKSRRASATNSKLTLQNCTAENDMLQDKSARAVECRWRTGHFNEALRVGPLSSQADRAKLVQETNGADMRTLNTAAGDHFSEEDMMATEPYVDDHFHLNKFHNGLVRSAMLNRLLKGKRCLSIEFLPNWVASLRHEEPSLCRLPAMLS